MPCPISQCFWAHSQPLPTPRALGESTNLPLFVAEDHTPLPTQGLSRDALPGLTSNTVALIFYGGFRNSLGKGKLLSENGFSFGHLCPSKVSLPAHAHKSTYPVLTGSDPLPVWELSPRVKVPRRGNKTRSSLTCIQQCPDPFLLLRFLDLLFCQHLVL